MEEEDFKRLASLITESRDATLLAVERVAGEANRVSKENRGKIDDILHLLNGNGNVVTGVVYKVEQLYKWMPDHILEHDKQLNEYIEKKKTKEMRQWDLFFGIIKWSLPFLIYGLAIGVVTIVQHFGGL